MANRVIYFLSSKTLNYQQIRSKYSRGIDPHLAKNLAQKLKEKENELRDPEVDFNVDIGFPYEPKKKSELMQRWIKDVENERKLAELEKKARNRELQIDLEKLNKEWLGTVAPLHVRRIAEHYGIFEDTFGEAYFHPIVPLNIEYDYGNEEVLAKVHRGNFIKSFEAKNAPNVIYESDPNTLWTLLLTTPDGNLSSPEYEYCHWFIGNIPGNKIEKGELLIDYLRPIPLKGIGACRYVFILYKQDKQIDFSEYKKEQPCLNLCERNWKTQDFYRKHQEYLTPAGLSFFQSDYDKTLKDFFHNTLEMMEPKFEYIFPEQYIKPQEWFPIRRPFNLYMDMYRDPKQINKEFLLKKLKKEHPFKFPKPPLKYPNAVKDTKYIPSWLKTEIVKERCGWGRINNYK